MADGWGLGEWGYMAWGTGDPYPYDAVIDISYFDCVVGNIPVAATSAFTVSAPTTVAAHRLNASYVPSYQREGTP